MKDHVVTVEQTAARQWVVYINGDALQDYYTHGQANHVANLVRAALSAERAEGWRAGRAAGTKEVSARVDELAVGYAEAKRHGYHTDADEAARRIAAAVHNFRDDYHD